jgi:hypothetical protein
VPFREGERGREKPGRTFREDEGERSPADVTDRLHGLFDKSASTQGSL